MPLLKDKTVKISIVLYNFDISSLGKKVPLMKSPDRVDKKKLSPEKIQKLNSRHLRGALVSSIASLIGWIFALIAFSAGVLKTHHLLMRPKLFRH